MFRHHLLKLALPLLLLCLITRTSSTETDSTSSIRIDKYKADSSLTSYSLREYDDLGRIVKFEIGDSLPDITMLVKYDGNVKRVEEYHSGVIASIRSAEYDSAGRIVKIYRSIQDSRYLEERYSYNPAGNLDTLFEYGLDGMPCYYIVKEYNAFDSLIYMTEFDSTFNVHFHEEVIYDTNGRKLYHNYMGADSAITQQLQYYYSSTAQLDSVIKRFPALYAFPAAITKYDYSECTKVTVLFDGMGDTGSVFVSQYDSLWNQTEQNDYYDSIHYTTRYQYIAGLDAYQPARDFVNDSLHSYWIYTFKTEPVSYIENSLSPSGMELYRMPNPVKSFNVLNAGCRNVNIIFYDTKGHAVCHINGNGAISTGMHNLADGHYFYKGMINGVRVLGVTTLLK